MSFEGVVLETCWREGGILRF